MSRWVALLDEVPDGAWASAEFAGGHLVVWDEQVEGALRADPRAFDASGAEAWVSWVRPPDDVSILFDDGSVQRARQLVLAGPPPLACTTLVRDGSHFAGALSAFAAESDLRDDPFARIWPARQGLAGPGLIGRPLPPTGPVLERYAGAPWPVDRFGSS